jgi:hypothetical protein
MRLQPRVIERLAKLEGRKRRKILKRGFMSKSAVEHEVLHVWKKTVGKEKPSDLEDNTIEKIVVVFDCHQRN